VSTAENLTRAEAAARAELLEVAGYEVHLDLTGGPDRFRSTSEVRFTARSEGDTFLDLTAEEVHAVELDGQPLPQAVVGPTRVRLEGLTPGDHRLRIVADHAYTHEGRGLHRFVDPADDRVYLHSQFEPFDAHLVYGCFDQPDLKATFSLSVDAPAEWVVVSNGSVTDRPAEGAAGTWRFSTTERVSTYITAVVAGAYATVSDVHTGPGAPGGELELGLYVRRSLAEHLDADEILEVTKQGLDWYARVFEMPYPFSGSYDQLFVPEFSAGAMENPGCITFSETYVFRSKVTDAIRERRAETILHEMAHMWFGDLVTMRWWDDLWLNESFATFMSVLCQAEATRWTGSWTTFLDAEKAWAKLQDQLPSTHPVADEMPDVESVHQNFDGITYAKGASVLRQLVAWVGQDEFLAGCRDYFERHAWGNTTLSDFLAALERASGRDLAEWRDRWLLTTGREPPRRRRRGRRRRQLPPGHARAELPRAELGRARGHPRAPRAAASRTVSPWACTGVGPMASSATSASSSTSTGHGTEVPDLVGAPAADLLLVNDDDLTYAKIALDDSSTAAVTADLDALVDPLARAQVWSATWDMVRDGELVRLAVRRAGPGNVASETEIGVLQRLLLRAASAAERYADPSHRPQLLAQLTRAARAQLEEAQPGSDHQLAWTRHWASTAKADVEQLADVRRVLDGELTIDGLAVDTDLRWHLLTGLTQAGEAGDAEVDAELERDPTDLGQRQALTARAAQPTAPAKEAAWERLTRGHLAVAHPLPAAVERLLPARPGGGARPVRRPLPRGARRGVGGSLPRLGDRVLDPHLPAPRRLRRPAGPGG
jgi:aminopeptidase N